MRSLLAVTGTLLLLALAPASAPAYMSAGEPIADPQVDAWVGIARAHWGGAPECPEGVRIDRAERLSTRYLWAAAEMPGCHISLDPDFYPAPATWTTTASGRAAWSEQMCNVVVHEWGHLLGEAHSENPKDLMYEVVPRVVPACRPARPVSSPRPTRRATAKPQRRSSRSRLEGARGPLKPS